jgi:catechol 2,3-dioxygenase-like lactoylglutathione lyase family enzyme
VIDHVTIRVSDLEASRRFYDTVLGTLGLTRAGDEWGDFSIAAGEPTRNLHVGFGAPDRETVDAFHRAGVEAGYTSDGLGERPQYTPGYYGGFLLDPDGNSVEAVHHEHVRDGIDHVWMRVADAAAAVRFYATIAPYAGIVQDAETHFTQLMLVEGEPSENVHIAWPASDNATVDAFHAAAIAAGYRDNGAPGERAIYHAGYYGAYVLDPDGNNVEVVNHNR